MRRTVLALCVIAGVIVPTTTSIVSAQVEKSLVPLEKRLPLPPGCHTQACARRVGRAWWLKHHPPQARIAGFHFGVTELCEAGRESGDGTVVNRSNAVALAHYINWKMEANGYEGGYSWLPSTWQHQRFSGYPFRAVDATAEQQTLVFRKWKNVGEWPPLAYCLS